MIARRKFLKIMGVSTAAAPLAAKQAAENEISQLTQMAARSSSQVLAGQAGIGGPCSDSHTDYLKQKAWSMMRGGQLPEHIEEMVRSDSKNVSFLDHDIAAKRSWSLAAKIHEQRQRNYANKVEHMREPNKFEFAQAAFEKITGFRWRIW